MAKLQTIKCPDCGSPLSFTEDQEYCFCSHCGSQVYKEDVHYDKNMELKMKQMEIEDRKDRRDSLLFLGILGIGVLIVILSLVFLLIMK